MKKIFLKLSLLFGILNIICILIFGGLVLLEVINKASKVKLPKFKKQ